MMTQFNSQPTQTQTFTITEQEENSLFNQFLPGYYRTSGESRAETNNKIDNALQPRHGKPKPKPVWIVNDQYFKSAATANIISNTRPNKKYLSSLQRMVFDATAWIKNYDDSLNYTNYINAWAYAHDLVYEETHQRQGLYNGLRVWEYEREMRFPKGIMIGYGMANTVANAKYLCDYAIYEHYIMNAPKVQMDGGNPKESVQGEATQMSEQSSNTIVTRDEGATVSDQYSEVKALDYCSTENIVTMPYVTERWMPMSFIKVSTTDKYASTLKSYYLPETLYSEIKSAVNLLPFESFIYGKYDIEFKFVTNANKFQCGKLIVSCKFDSYQADAMQNSVQSALCRPHVMIDLATNVEAQLNVPFRYHRTMVRNVKNDLSSVGIRPSKYATVYVQVLSPLQTGKDGSTDMYIRPYVRIREAQFTGMSYRVAVQMDSLVPILKEALPTKEVRDVLRSAEVLLKTLGETKNRDKPTTMEAMVTVPRTRLNFGSGKGLIDAIPLRNNPYAMTTFTHIRPFEDEPKTMLDIATIWGLRNSTTWKQGSKPGEMLFDIIVDPSTRSYDKKYTGTPTPLEYVCNMYAFWAGTIEFRVDFISNAFHTGAIMLAAEFGRPSGGSDEKLAASTYTKTFHLGDQKSVHFTVPYIYDTVWRRNNNAVFNPIFDRADAADNTVRKGALDIMAKVRTHFRAYVINELRPVQTAPQEIEMLIYWRASPSFMVHGLCQQSYIPLTSLSGKVPAIDRFPYDGYEPLTPANASSKSKRSIDAKDIHNPPNMNEWRELPRVQMDNGEKEDEDCTEDFNTGKFNLALQTTDSQLSLKDILRRPTLLLLSKKVDGYGAGKTHGYFIPLMPPCRQMQYVASKENHIWSELLGQTPQAAIMNMFRFWRGSMRYTIIVESATDPMIYITHVPHTGTRLFGNMSIMGSTTTSNRPLFGCGLSTEVMSPLVNNSAVFEAPYDTELDWTLTFEEDPQRNYAWRDKGDTNAGHICIQSKNDCTITVFWSAGDDFEIGNFYGIPEGVQNDADKLYTDEHARVQMDQDFQTEEESYVSKLLQVAKKTAIPAGLASVPMVGPALTTAYAAYRVEPVLNEAKRTLQRVQETAEQATMTAATIEQSTAQITHCVTDVAHMAHNTMHNVSEQVTAAIGTIMSTLTVAADLKTIIENALFDVIGAWLTKSWQIVGLGIARIVNQLLGGSLAVLQYGMEIATAIKSYFVDTPTVQAENEKTIVGILCAIVSAVVGIYIDPSNHGKQLLAFGKIFTTNQGMAHINQVIRFVSTTFDTLKEIIMSAIGLVDPEVQAIKALCTNSEMIGKFVSDAQLCLSEANSPMLLSPNLRQKFWLTVMRAYQIQKAMASVPNNMARPMLSKVCSDVIKAGTEKFVDLSCSPVRYEPFVVCFVGESQIGKSYLVDGMAERMMQHIGFNRTVAELTYTRSVGSKYWSSYRNQPVIVYDDWLNINSSTSIEQQISELYQLKTTNKFIPEMANIEEKKLSANPLVVMLVCNDAFPSGMSNIAPHPEAVYRRRDIVVEVTLKPEFVGKDLRSVLTEEQSNNFEHLMFSIYNNSRDERSKSEVKMTFADFLPYYLQRYLRYHRQEQVNVRKRVDRLERRLGMAPGEMLGDPFEMLYTVQSEEYDQGQNAYLPSEQLELAVLDLVSAVERSNERMPIEIPDEPENPFVQADCGMWELAKWALSGITSTPAMIAWIGEQTIETITSIDFDFTASSVVIGTCAICKEDNKQMAYQCKNQREEGNSHSICVGCYAESLRSDHNAERQCPMCRSPDMIMLLTRTGKYYMTIANWIIKNGRKYIVPLVRRLCAFMKHVPMRAIYWIQTLADLVRFLFNPTALPLLVRSSASLAADMMLRPGTEIYQDLEEHPLGAASTMMLNVAIGPRIQADEDTIWNPFTRQYEDNRVIDEPEQREFGIFEPSAFREDIYDDMEEREMPCAHDEVLSYVSSVRYKWNPTDNESGWVLPMRRDGQVVMASVPDVKCKQENCPFRSRERYEAFIARYTSLNLPALRQAIVKCYNERTGDQRQIALKTIPRVVRPMWLEGPVIQPYTSNWWEYLEGQYEKYKTFINFTIKFVGVLGSLYAAAKMWNYMTQPTASALQGDMNYNVNEARQLRKVVAPRAIRPVRVQADQLEDVVLQKVYKNYMLIKIYENDKIIKQLGVAGICGHYAMLPRHYIKALEFYAQKKMTIEPAIYINGDANHLRKDFTYDSNATVSMSNTDLAMIKLPNSCAMFQDIRRFFQTDAEMQGYYPNTANILLLPTRSRSYLSIKQIDLEGIEQQVRFDDSDDSSFWATNVLKYNHSEMGACGSIVMVSNHQHPLRAMHVAGCDRTQMGYGVLVSREMIDELIADRIVLQYEDMELEDLAERTDAMMFDENTRVDYLGALPKGEAPHIPTKTKIEPSLIAKVLEPAITTPGILTSSDPRYKHERSPLYYGAIKHGKPTKDFTQTQVSEAEEAIWDLLIGPMRPAVMNPKRLTIEEAVKGLEGVEFYEPMRLDTSAGWPWSKKDISDSTKRAWCNVERDEHGNIVNVEVKQALRDEIKRKEELRRKGIVPATVFVDTLKDERRKFAKAMKAGGTRVFCASPLDYTMATRQNLLHFCAAFMKARLTVNSAVGINAKGTEWTELFRKLTAVSAKNIVMMDYSNFGPGFNAVVSQSAANLMIRWVLKNVEGVDETELRALLQECISSVHVAGSTVYRQFSGSPSGAPITTIINTLVNLLYLFISWKHLAGPRALKKHNDIYQVFLKYCATVCYGDDFIMSVHDDFKDVFNTNTIRDYLATYDIAATSAEKDLIDIPDFVPINKASFLKRTFRRHDTREGLVLGPLEEESLLEIPKWIWKCQDQKAATRVNVESALMEAHAYGPKYFDEYKKKLNNALTKIRAQPVALQWTSLDNQWFTNTLGFCDVLNY